MIDAIFKFLIKEFPITPRIKAGPALTQNRSILSACSEFISFLSKRSFMPRAPTGNPPIMLSKITDEDDGGRKNRNLDTGDNNLPNIWKIPEFTIRHEKKINGNNAGTRVFRHIFIPDVTPFIDSLGCKTRKIPNSTVKTKDIEFEKIFFTFIITLFMRCIYFLCVGGK